STRMWREFLARLWSWTGSRTFDRCPTLSWSGGRCLEHFEHAGGRRYQFPLLCNDIDAGETSRTSEHRAASQRGQIAISGGNIVDVEIERGEGEKALSLRPDRMTHGDVGQCRYGAAVDVSLLVLDVR